MSADKAQADHGPMFVEWMKACNSEFAGRYGQRLTMSPARWSLADWQRMYLLKLTPMAAVECCAITQLG